jgi:hypothetical protein
VNCAVFCVKDEWKNSYEACAIPCQNCAVNSVLPSGTTSHSKIAQFSWECIGHFTHQRRPHCTVGKLNSSCAAGLGAQWGPECTYEYYQLIRIVWVHYVVYWWDPMYRCNDRLTQLFTKYKYIWLWLQCFDPLLGHHMTQ